MMWQEASVETLTNSRIILTGEWVMRSAGQLENRVRKLQRVLQDRPRADQLGVIQAIPVANAGGRPLGLHRVGPRGSTGGVLVYDPAQGHATLPDEERTRGAFFVVCDPESYESGRDYADWGV